LLAELEVVPSALFGSDCAYPGERRDAMPTTTTTLLGNTPLRRFLTAALGLGLVTAIGAGATPAAIDTVREIPGRGTVFTPGLGALVIANGEPIEVEILPSDAGVESDIYLTKLLTVPVRSLLGTNRDAGKVTSFESFGAGEELRFEIFVHSTGLTYSTGPADRNPDNLAHATVVATSPTSFTVGFEDVFGGGDRDYNDVQLRVRMATPSSGLDLQRLGGADLTATPDGQIVVSNLSDSGEDGVSIGLAHAKGWRLSTQGLHRTTLGGKGEATLQTRGKVGGLDQNVGRSRVVLDQGKLRTAGDFSGLGARGARITLLGKGRRQLAQRVMSNDELMELICPPLSFLSSIALDMTVKIHPDEPGKVTVVIDGIEAWDCTLGPVPAVLGAHQGARGAAAVAQEPITALELTAEDPEAAPEELSEARLLTQGISELTIAREALQITEDGPFFTGLGQATLEAGEGSLTVGHLGAGGGDGVTLDPGGPAAMLAFAVTPYAAASPPAGPADGAYLEIGAHGFAGASDARDLARLRLTSHDGRPEVTADVSPLGATAVRLVVLEGNRPVADFASPTGTLGRAARWPTVARVGHLEVGGEPVWGFRLDFQGVQEIQLASGPTVVGDHLLALVEAPAPPLGALTEVHLLGSQAPPVTFVGTAVAPACSGDEFGLCLNGGRFRVEVDWQTPQGTSGAGHARPLTDDTGTFWFFDPDNLEMVVKSLDACSFANRFWNFAGGLTNVEVMTTVTDTLTGEERQYHKPPRTPFDPILDTGAFGTCGQRAEDNLLTSSAPPPLPVSSPSLLLDHGRFRIDVVWTTAQGTSGTGQAVRLTEDTGYFWFFEPANVELLVKTLDACSFADRFWVFAGGLTNVEVEMEVTDTATGAVRHYSNEQGTAFTPVLDTNAFATCP
jgi:hypothetical protein